MDGKVRSYSKATQLGQKEPDTPNFKPRKYNRRRKHNKKHDTKGVKIPSRANRAEFSGKQRQKIHDLWGDGCYLCSNPYIQYHHIRYRSQLGRNNPRNGIPLCERCHTRVHAEREVSDYLRNLAEDRFGTYFYYDKFDAWKQGLIDRPTDKLFEEFMEKEMKKHGK